MQILVLIPAFLLFTYCIYKLVKDDYVFIRRSISLEQMFDITFLVIASSLVFSRLLFFILHPLAHKNIFLLFFTPRIGGLSLLGGVIGGYLSLYMIGKYKKIPFGRLFDFFTLAFVVCLPFGFLTSSLFMTGYQLFLYLFNAGVYLLLTVFFVRFIYPKLMSRELREGSLQSIFLLFFAFFSLINVIFLQQKGQIIFVSLESILLLFLFLFSLFLFFK